MFISPLRKWRIREIIRLQDLILRLDETYGEGNDLSARATRSRDRLMKKINFTSDQLARVNFMLRSEV